MLEHTFPVFELLDAWIDRWLPDLLRVCVWGAASGGLAMLLYVVGSDQAGITELKSRIKELQRRMLRADMEHAEVMRLAKDNLVVSLRLLRKVGLPSLLASAPVLIVVVWLSAFDSYALPAGGDTVRVEVIPPGRHLTFMPVDAFEGAEGSLRYVVGVENGPVRVLDGEQPLYSGEPQALPVGAVYKRVWWNQLLGSGAGYIREGAPIDEIRWHFPRKTFLPGVPGWMSTWEFPFFLSLIIVAIALKFGFRIQ